MGRIHISQLVDKSSNIYCSTLLDTTLPYGTVTIPLYQMLLCVSAGYITLHYITIWSCYLTSLLDATLCQQATLIYTTLPHGPVTLPLYQMLLYVSAGYITLH